MRIVYFLSVCFGAATILLGFVETSNAQSWQEVEPLPAPRYGMAAVEWNGDLYVVGGRDRHGHPLSSLLRYDPDTDTWHSDLESMSAPRAEPAAVVLDGLIYVIGGAGEDEKPVADVFVFDPSQNQWSEGEALEHNRYGHGAIAVEGAILVAGGRDDEGQLVEEVEVFRPNVDRWTVSSDWALKNPRVSFALVAIADAIYAMFGYGSSGPLPDGERLDQLTDVDVFVLSFLLRGRLATASIDNTAYLMGGRAEPDHVINEVLLFTPSEENILERWRQGPSMLAARESFAAVTSGSEIYAIGGRTQDGTRDGMTLSSVERLAVSTGIEENEYGSASSFRLEQNHPNPFTNSTTIPFILDGRTVERVTIEVYDLQGRLLDTMVDRPMPPGRHEVRWDGESVRTLTSGTYVYVLKHGQNRQVRTMTAIR